MELLNCKYIIDGVPMENTPAQILSQVSAPGVVCPDAGVSGQTLADETVDPLPGGHILDPGRCREYLSALKGATRPYPMAFSAQHTRALIAGALIDEIWSGGHFVLEDLFIQGVWRWKDAGVGSLAAFYESISAAAEIADSLDLRFDCADVKEGDPLALFSASHAGESEPRTLPREMTADPHSWIVYIPFETSAYRLGGSRLAAALGYGGGTAPEIADPDYFMDCYEVVREMVEDGIFLSGATVLDGGLVSALDRLSGRLSVEIDLSDMKRALETSDIMRLLFAEVPGVLVQIRDDDFDYLDAELLLQDVMFFPLGHPGAEGGGIHIKSPGKTGIESILSSLMR